MFPLFYASENRSENISPEFRGFIDSLYCHPSEPEEIFNYIYAVLHAHTYRDRYADFLRIDFPRIPFPDSHENFEALSSLGSDLVSAHLMRDVPDTDHGDFRGQGDFKVLQRKWEPSARASDGEDALGRLRINPDQYFERVPKDVWEFEIGGYQVLDKYLKDRAGRTLSLDEVENIERIVRVLVFTLDQMRAIDAAYLQAFPAADLPDGAEAA